MTYNLERTADCYAEISFMKIHACAFLKKAGSELQDDQFACGWNKNAVIWKCFITRYFTHIAYKERGFRLSSLGLTMTPVADMTRVHNGRPVLSLCDLTPRAWFAVFVFRSSIYLGCWACTILFINTHKSESGGVRSGKFGGQSMGPRRSHQLLNVSFRKLRTCMDRCCATHAK